MLWLFLGVFFFLLFVWMHWVEPRLFEFNRYQVAIQKKISRPVKILHLSDTHFAGNNKPLSRFFDRLAREEIDMVVFTGDIMDCDAGIRECVQNISKLKPRHGIYAVFGNHDYYDYKKLDSLIHNFPGQGFPVTVNRINMFAEELGKIGVRVFRNETLSLLIDGSEFLIHGLDDPTTNHANIRKTLENYDPKKINVLLTHTIDVFLDIGEGEIDLAFSGHSHGGQIRLPFFGPLITHTRLGRQYASGIFEMQKAICCVSRGMSANRHLKPRLFCRPEAILLTVIGN